MDESEQENRGVVFWGLALVTAGSVALLIQSGAIAEVNASRRRP